MNYSVNNRYQSGFVKFVLLLLLAVLAFWGFLVYRFAETFHEYLTENNQLKASISRLTQESQIGYAKVLDQKEKDGKLVTTLAFFQNDRDDPNQRIFEGEYTIEGNIAHFDALIVKFDNNMVMDNQERSIFLWRRIYGEQMAPSEGYEIEKEGAEPSRYKDLLGDPTIWDKILLKKDYSSQFWQTIWELANDQEKLKEYGVSAVYGNVTYVKLEPGLIYLFKINNAGQIHPEVIPAL